MDNQIRDLKYKLLQLANCDETLQTLLRSLENDDFNKLFTAFLNEYNLRGRPPIVDWPSAEDTPIPDGPIAYPW